jgi:O-acetyl-ADP-ribose deacetylase (regulator of RNase III)
MKEATEIAIKSVQEYFKHHEQSHLQRVVFCTYSEADEQVYTDMVRAMFT